MKNPFTVISATAVLVLLLFVGAIAAFALDNKSLGIGSVSLGFLVLLGGILWWARLESGHEHDHQIPPPPQLRPLKDIPMRRPDAPSGDKP